MTNAKKATGLKKSKKPQPRQGWITREYISYAMVWFIGLAIGAWLF